MVSLEDKILADIEIQWKNFDYKRTTNINNELKNNFINLLNFYDKIYDTLQKNNKATNYDITKKIIIVNLRDNLIEEIKDNKMYEEILREYYNQKI